MFVNHYKCPQCEHLWSDTWDCTCNDECPVCGLGDIMPNHSDDADSGKLRWRRVEEHTQQFEDGERLFVAVELADGVEFAIITVRVDGDNFDTYIADGLEWGWDWPDVSWWLPISELKATLPYEESDNAMEAT